MRVLRTSLGFYFFLSLCLWMSVPVSSSVMSHCVCVYFSSSWYLFPCSLNIRINVRLYCDSLYVYMYVSWYMLFCLLSEFFGFRQYCHWLSVYRFVSWSAFLSMFLFVLVSAYIAVNSACICTSLYLCFPLTFCLWICTRVSEYIIIHSWCICTFLDPCICLSFSLIVYVCVRLYRHWLYVYRYVCYSACLSISLYVCLCQCPGILSVICMDVKKRVQLSQCVVAL